MNKSRILSFMASAVAAVSLLTGCSTENDMENGKEGLASLELSSVISSDMLTRAVIDGTAFPTDKGNIGLFLYEDKATSKAYGDGYENIQYFYNAVKGKWTANPSIRVGSTPGYLFGYYPYNAANTDVKAIPVISSVNGDDVMYASKQQNAITDKTAANTSITMNHALARVAIKVINNGYTGEAKLSSIKFEDATIANSGTLDVTSGSITASEADEVTLFVPTAEQTIATGDGTTYECLLVPVPSEESDDRQDVDLYLTIDGQEKSLHLSDDNGVIFKQGVKSTVTITLSNTGIALKTVSIEGWDVVEVEEHKVKVKFDEGVSGIEEDVLVTAYAKNGDVVIRSFSNSGKTITCQLDDDTMVKSVSVGNLSVFTIPDVSKDIVATIGVRGEGGRNLITVGGHKITVGLAGGVTESDVWFNAYVNSDGKAAVSVQSNNGKKFSFRRNDTGTILGIAPQDNIYDIALAEANQDITVTIDYFLNSNPEFATISGHKVSVVLDAGTDILKGISTDDGKLVIEAESSSGKPVKCVRNEDRIAGSKTGTLYKFAISDITDDVTVTVGYSKYTATIGFTQGSATDKATLKINGEEFEAGGSISVYEGTNVVYSAVTDADGYFLWGWYDDSGQKVRDAEPFTINNITADVAYYAEVKAGCILTVNSFSSGTSTITVNGVSIESGRVNYYSPNSTITLTANPATRFDFVKWCDTDGNTLSTDNPYSFTLSDNLTITAVFAPQGALSGVFSVSPTRKVRFSKGNLWYGPEAGASTATFNFESNQYDTTPSAKDQERDDNHISHFMWCKSEEESIKLAYAETGTGSSDNLFTNESPDSPNSQFTVNGQKGVWRVLSGGANEGEWKYLIDRKDPDGNSFHKANVTVCGYNNCLILLPDDWKWGENGVGTCWQDSYSEETPVKWSTMEAAGAVCLPRTGCRFTKGEYVRNISNIDVYCDYWSASPKDSEAAYGLYLYYLTGSITPTIYSNRYLAQPIRLVTDVK